MTKTVLTLCFASLLTLYGFGQTETYDSISRDLVGSWEFVELLDKDGTPVDTIWHGMGYEIPKGPLMIYNADGTYSKEFTPSNIDKGMWSFNRQENSIIHKLYYFKPYSWVEKSQIENGKAIQDEDGEYYEVVTAQVVELTAENLIVLEKKGQHRVYKKKID